LDEIKEVKIYSGDTEISEKKKAAKDHFFCLWHIIAVFMGIAITLFRSYIEMYPQKIEYGYSRAIYPYIAYILSLPGRWMPLYSVSELFFGTVFSIVLITLCCHFYFSVRRKVPKTKLILKTLCHIIAVFSAGYFLYMTIWGFNYLRESFAVSLNQGEAKDLAESDYERLAEDMISLVNTVRSPGPAETDELWETDDTVSITVRRVVAMAYISRIPSLPPTKILFANGILNAFGISGFFSPLFMEPHINADLLPWERPLVMAHEKAHFLGFASETDAGFIAYLTCLTAESDLLRYSGALNILLSLHSYLPEKKWLMFREKLPEQAQYDIKARQERIQQNYERYPRLIRAGRSINDLYLRLNSQTLGIASYRAALPHLTLWWKKQMSGFRVR